MCAVCSECNLNLVAGQVFVGACSVGFFSDLYYQCANVVGYIVFALVDCDLICLAGCYRLSVENVEPKNINT